MDQTASSSASMSSHPLPTHSASWTCHRCECHNQVSPQSSPHSASLPSPPDSPPLDPFADTDLDSVSSFPSVSSSIFFSSSASSPHSQSRHQEHDHDAGLIIPSLTLPSAFHQPTPYGQTLGDLSLLFVGPSGGGKTLLAEFLADGDDIVDAEDWEDIKGGSVMRASTDWIEEHDAHGLERFEGAENVTFTELDGFDNTENPTRVADRVLRSIHEVFSNVRNQIDSAPSSTLLHTLLASSNSPLFTALIYVTATPLTEQDHEIISALSSAIPIVLFCTTSLSSALTPFSHAACSPPKLASFQPYSQLSLRTGLFRNPQTISALRAEAADRFMRWREAERAMERLTPAISAIDNPKLQGFSGHRRHAITQYSGDGEETEKWSKATWEAMLSEDVGRRLQQARLLEKSNSDSTSSSANSVLFSATPCFAPSLDPLHFRSLVLFSMSLLVPRSSFGSRSSHFTSKDTIMDGTRSTVRPSLSRSHSSTDKSKVDVGTDRWRYWRWGLALFCAGVGIGYILSAIA